MDKNGQTCTGQASRTYLSCEQHLLALARSRDLVEQRFGSSRKVVKYSPFTIYQLLVIREESVVPGELSQTNQTLDSNIFGSDLTCLV